MTLYDFFGLGIRGALSEQSLLGSLMRYYNQNFHHDCGLLKA